VLTPLGTRVELRASHDLVRETLKSLAETTQSGSPERRPLL